MSAVDRAVPDRRPDRPRHAALRSRSTARRYTGHRGDTLASALLANGVAPGRAPASSCGRPRGIMAAGRRGRRTRSSRSRRRFPEPMLAGHHRRAVRRAGGARPARAGPAGADARRRPLRRACTCTATCSSSAPGRPASRPRWPRRGPAPGWSWLDDQPEPGGALLGTDERIDGGPACDWVGRAIAELAADPEVRVLPRTTAFGYYDDGFVLAVERRTDHLGAPHRARVPAAGLAHPGARRSSLATGAHERPIVVRRQRPPRHHARRRRPHLPAPLRRAAPAAGPSCSPPTTAPTPPPSTSPTPGVEVAAVVDARPQATVRVRPGVPRPRHRGPDRAASSPAPTGADGVTAWHVAAGRRRPATAAASAATCCWSPAAGTRPCTCSARPAAGCATTTRSGRSCPAPTSTASRWPAPRRRVRRSAACLRDGAAAAPAAVGRAASTRRGAAPPVDRRPAAGAVADAVVGARPAERTAAARQLRRPAARRDRRRHRRARSAPACARSSTSSATRRSGPRTTRARPRACIASGDRRRRCSACRIADAGHDHVPAAVHAGLRSRRSPGATAGDLFDPVRVTPIHDWHVAHGAVFEDVGQWKRPRYYPRAGRGHGRRRAARVRGRPRRAWRSWTPPRSARSTCRAPTPAGFLDRLYTNLISTLKVGSIRYGVMCGLDGMVFDDGTVDAPGRGPVPRHHHDRQRGDVLDWMEEWLQTEWPHLRVRLHVGDRAVGDGRPGRARARATCSPRVAPELAVDNDGVPVHDLARRRGRRAAGARLPDQLLRRARLRGQRRRPGTGWRCGRRCWRPGQPSASRRTAPRRCTCCAPRRATRSSARTPTARSPRTTSAWPGWCRRRRPTSSASGRSPAPTPRAPTASSWSALLPVDPDVLLPEGAQLVDAAAAARAAGADARPRHLELPQRGARTDVRAGPGEGRPRPDRRDGCTSPVDGAAGRR